MGQATGSGSRDSAEGSFLKQEEREASLFKQNGSNFSLQCLRKVCTDWRLFGKREESARLGTQGCSIELLS